MRNVLPSWHMILNGGLIVSTQDTEVRGLIPFGDIGKSETLQVVTGIAYAKKARMPMGNKVYIVGCNALFRNVLLKTVDMFKLKVF